ncbi:MAG: hypothetical protein IJS93_03570 [Clostridia bacterium]|nr:hypothetical protein [Clostridia bacterium]
MGIENCTLFEGVQFFKASVQKKSAFERSVQIVSFTQFFFIKETSFVYHGKRGFSCILGKNREIKIKMPVDRIIVRNSGVEVQFAAESASKKKM